MANYLTTDTDLTSVANAIRAKSGGSSQLAFPAGFVSEIGNIPSGGGGVTVETAEETIDNKKQTSLTFPVTSTNYDNIVGVFAITEFWHYENGVAVKDDPISIPTFSDGFDYYVGFAKTRSSPRFSGSINSGGASLSNVYDYLKICISARNSNSPQSYGAFTGLTLNSSSIVVLAARAFCQSGYKIKFSAKFYFWND